MSDPGDRQGEERIPPRRFRVCLDCGSAVPNLNAPCSVNESGYHRPKLFVPLASYQAAEHQVEALREDYHRAEEALAHEAAEVERLREALERIRDRASHMGHARSIATQALAPSQEGGEPGYNVGVTIDGKETRFDAPSQGEAGNAMFVVIAIALVGVVLWWAASALAFSPPNTTDLQIITGEGHQVTATWRSTEPSHFHCWLTGKRRLPCTPPKTYDGLAPGTYTLHVRAFGNESGLRETTPASGSFRIP